jgi:hypothetical protein
MRMPLLRTCTSAYDRDFLLLGHRLRRHRLEPRKAHVRYGFVSFQILPLGMPPYLLRVLFPFRLRLPVHLAF